MLLPPYSFLPDPNAGDRPRRDGGGEGGEGGDDDAGIRGQTPGLERGKRLEPLSERALVIVEKRRKFENSSIFPCSFFSFLLSPYSFFSFKLKQESKVVGEAVGFGQSGREREDEAVGAGE